MGEDTMTRLRWSRTSRGKKIFGLAMMLALGLLAFRGAVCIVMEDHSTALDYLVCLREERALELDSLPPLRECIAPAA